MAQNFSKTCDACGAIMDFHADRLKHETYVAEKDTYGIHKRYKTVRTIDLCDFCMEQFLNNLDMEE